MVKQNYQKIGDVFNEVLNGDVLKNALDFMEFLSVHEIIQADQYAMHYNDKYHSGKCVCYLDTRNEHHSWIVWTEGDYSSEKRHFQLMNVQRKSHGQML